MTFIVLHTICNTESGTYSQLQGIYSFCDLHKSFPVKEQFCLYNICGGFMHNHKLKRGLPAAVNGKL